MSAEVVQFARPRRRRADPKRSAEKKRRHLAWYQAFGARLRATRLTLGIGETEAAAASLVTLRAYRRREAGLPFRSWHEGLVSFAQKYDLSFAWLFAGYGPIRAADFDAVIQRYIQEQKPKPKLTLVQ
jgi:transcriptional regulator with XRE-family HTH domain